MVGTWRTGVVIPIANGTVGETVTVPDAEFNQVACASDRRCYAVGDEMVAPTRPEGVACTSGAGCQGRPPASVGTALRTETVVVPITDGRVGKAIPVPGPRALTDIACPGGSTCYAMGQGFDASKNQAVGFLVPITAGALGAIASAPGVYLHGFFCSSATVCYAAGAKALGHQGLLTVGVVAPVTSGRMGPASVALGTALLAHGVCVTTSTCLVTGTGGSGPLRGEAISLVSGHLGVAHAIPGASMVTDILCLTGSTCDLVGWSADPETSAATGIFATLDVAAPAIRSSHLTDVGPGSWERPYVDELVTAGAIGGFPGGAFRPALPVTRAEFAKMLVLALDMTPQGGETEFTDVPPDAWYAPYVAAADQRNLMHGTSPTLFRPNEVLSREAAAMIVVRVLRLTQTAPLPFGDSATIDPWAQRAVAEAVEAGFMQGFPDGSFGPRRPLTRAQAAVLAGLIRAQSGL